MLTLATFITAGDFRGHVKTNNDKLIEIFAIDIATDWPIGLFKLSKRLPSADYRFLQ